MAEWLIGIGKENSIEHFPLMPPLYHYMNCIKHSNHHFLSAITWDIIILSV